MTAAVETPILTGAAIQAKYNRARALIPHLSRAGRNKDAEKLIDDLELIHLDMREVLRCPKEERQERLQKIDVHIDAAVQKVNPPMEAEAQPVVEQLVPGQDALVLSHIAKAIGLSVATVRYWVERGKLQSCGTGATGHPLYPLAVAEDLAAKRQIHVPRAGKPTAKPVENIPDPIAPAPKPLLTIVPTPATWSVKDKSILNKFIAEPFANGWEVA